MENQAAGKVCESHQSEECSYERNCRKSSLAVTDECQDRNGNPTTEPDCSQSTGNIGFSPLPGVHPPASNGCEHAASDHGNRPRHCRVSTVVAPYQGDQLPYTPKHKGPTPVLCSAASFPDHALEQIDPVQ